MTPVGGQRVILSCHHAPFMGVWHPDGVLAAPLCVCTCRHAHLLLDSFILQSLCSHLVVYKVKTEWGKNCCDNIFSIDGNSHTQSKAKAKGKGKGRVDTRKCFMEPVTVCLQHICAQHFSPKHCGFSFVTLFLSLCIATSLLSARHSSHFVFQSDKENYFRTSARDFTVLCMLF